VLCRLKEVHPIDPDQKEVVVVSWSPGFIGLESRSDTSEVGIESTVIVRESALLSRLFSSVMRLISVD